MAPPAVEERRRDQAAAPGVKMAKGTVARGRTVMIPDPTKRVHAGYDQEGKAIHRPVLHSYGPGREVELPASEIKELRLTGYLIDPEKTAPPVGDGPNYSEAGRENAARPS